MARKIKVEKGVKGLIKTSGDQLLVYKVIEGAGPHAYQYAQYCFRDGTCSHLDAIKMVAKEVFGAGKLRKYSGVDANEVKGNRLATRWGWTHENRPAGKISVMVDHYEVR